MIWRHAEFGTLRPGLDSGELSDRKELDTVRLVRAYQSLQAEAPKAQKAFLKKDKEIDTFNPGEINV